jgi:hypothetical protein
MRKPEAAHLMDWFYEIPPYRWFLPLRGSRAQSRNIRARNLNMRWLGKSVKMAILGPNAATGAPARPGAQFR